MIRERVSFSDEGPLLETLVFVSLRFKGRKMSSTVGRKAKTRRKVCVFLQKRVRVDGA